jgi:hypothetical protein
MKKKKQYNFNPLPTLDKQASSHFSERKKQAKEMSMSSTNNGRKTQEDEEEEGTVLPGPMMVDTHS